jgi:hypothetical protein
MLPYLTSGPKVFKLFKKYKGQSVNDIADRHFRKGTPLYRLITNLAYPRMGISGLAGYFAMISEDYWHVVEGMQHLADVLADRFRRNGGDLRLGAPVEKILTKDGAAAGVVSRGASLSKRTPSSPPATSSGHSSSSSMIHRSSRRSNLKISGKRPSPRAFSRFTWDSPCRTKS